MKIRFKDKEVARSVNALQNEYKVVAKEKDRQGEYVYTYFNDELHVMKTSGDHIEITDDDMSDMIQRNDLGFGNEFYINEFFIQLLPVNNGHLINISHIWSASKVFRYFEKYNYQIPDSYRDKALNENYKIGLIEGFLMAIKPYMERKFTGGNYFESFEFYKGKAISEIELNINDSLEELNVSEYKELLKNFIEKYLHDTEENTSNSKAFSNTLFALIDSLFIYDITRIFSYKTFYNNCFVIEHQNEYYYLKQFWWG
ncbi:hypothetical protein DRF65_23110 [Chryseobacterium pennae]|uniref:Uncharacterized protein n=1 Tax=Chryseobacterium pennae TaxID=2258962 RepID=A0A3D9C3M1_9FLAO|nr:hypothetical protein [Chryseobacterium pennae]REC60081.1 hypothetical protein DRF65_23110 [Chryseobacterium pennae]